MSFSGNFNNFGVIYFITEGVPMPIAPDGVCRRYGYPDFLDVYADGRSEDLQYGERLFDFDLYCRWFHRCMELLPDKSI